MSLIPGQTIRRRRQWHPTPILLPGKSHGQRSLVGCSPHGVVKSQTQLSEHTFTRKAHYSVFSSFLIHCPKLVRNHFGLPESISQKIMAPHTSTLAWKIPWTEEPGMLQSTGSLRVGHDWATSLLLFTFMHWRRKWQPTPVFFPGKSHGQRSLVGCCLWGHTESDTTEVT